jgi:hypothetical protein
MALPEVDYCELHLYPQDNAAKLGSAPRIEQAIDDAAQLARFVVGKPLVLGEVGFRDEATAWEGRDRVGWFDLVLRRVADDGVAGALAWVYEPWRRRHRRYGIYVGTELSTAVRRVLHAHAERLGRGLVPELANPALQLAHGARPILEQHVSLRTTRPPAAAWTSLPDGTVELALAPGDHRAARWERFGEWDGGPLVQAYGADSGWFEYAFSLPVEVPARELTFRARLATEFVGRGVEEGRPSRVDVILDGTRVAELLAVPDDGVGRWVEVRVQDPRLLGAGPHVLRLAVPPGPEANGLTVYGWATGRAPAVADAGPITLTLRRGDADRPRPAAARM